MFSKKQHNPLQILILFCIIHLGTALQCKTCEKKDAVCLLGHDVEREQCAGDDDFCYSWFDRTITDVAVQRGCISPTMLKYKMIRDLMGGRGSECIKRLNGLDCFKICSVDNCN